VPSFEEINFRGLLDWPLWARRCIEKRLEQLFEEDPFPQEPTDFWKI
jgi:hypothetical protein